MVKDHKYTPIKLSWISSSPMRAKSINTKSPDPSYSRIGTFNQAGDHVIEIQGTTVILNGKKIARAPHMMTRTKQDRFCRAIVWGLINDPGALQDKVKETGALPGPLVPVPEVPPVPEPFYVTPGPRSLFGWIRSGPFLVKEEGIS